MKYLPIPAAPSCFRPVFCAATALVATSLLLSGNAFAQDAGEATAEPDAAPVVDLEDEDDALDGTNSEATPDETLAADEEQPEENTKRKSDGSTQLLIGARYRAMIAPKFLINMFGVDGGRTVFLNGVGGEIGGYFGKQGDGFMAMLGIWHQWYGMDATPFKGKKDDDSAWEIINSDLGIVYIAADAMWDHKIVDRLSVLVGGGFGIGIVRGSLYRNEAYQDNSGNAELPADKDWPSLSRCTGPNSPNAIECPSDGNYGKASAWPVYPWLNFQMGLKYQPVDEFIGRLELGVGSSGFWLGLGADYSLFL